MLCTSECHNGPWPCFWKGTVDNMPPLVFSNRAQVQYNWLLLHPIMGNWLNVNVDKFGKLMSISLEVKKEKADLYTLHKEVYSVYYSVSLLWFMMGISTRPYLCSSMILLLRCSQNLAPIFTKRRCPLKNWAQVVERRFHVQFLGPSAFPWGKSIINFSVGV